MKKIVSGNKYDLEKNFGFLFLIFCCYIFISFNSSGYHQEDEHYQIIEFVNYKLGLVPANRLAWEFNAQIRSGFQPLLCYVFLNIAKAFGISNGFNLAFFLRAVTAVFSIFVVRNFITIYKNELFPKYRAWFIVSSYFLWFLPYIYVRFSSENWSGLLLLLALSQLKIVTKDISKYNLILPGLLLGFSILLRYQSALAVSGIFLWMVIVQNSTWRSFFVLSLSIALTLLFGVMADYWLYGKLTFTLFNYFWVNLVEGVSANYGVSPWYEYLIDILLDPGAFGIVIAASFIILICFKPRHIIIWTIVPFLLIHSLIPHKELRFLFPLAGLVPLLCFIALQDSVQRFSLKKSNAGRRKTLVFLIIAFFIVIDVAGLLCISLTGAGFQRIPVAEYINRNYDLKNTRIIMAGDINPYVDWGPPKNSYYSSAGLDVKWVDNIWRGEFKSLLKSQKTNLLVIAEIDSKGPLTTKLLRQCGFKKVYQNIPEIVKLIYDSYDPSLLDRSLEVYEFINQPGSRQSLSSTNENYKIRLRFFRVFSQRAQFSHKIGLVLK